ncbi:protoporphyrinogen/coproporphyrinogen oxidase [Dysgonomonas macrotermitis]|uniref:UDP-galactopyranose mutase n=1 Tax=Dysgonomonas macrotermitis TaxID=1346286 RepID=A0A1M5AVV1_9BACT|nr:NAD(P)-binding protein [Dysgonomonas macrotermitis]SHF34217.1 UDP-galactopyranose mutase [Dysgonomonas macrotermitis]
MNDSRKIKIGILGAGISGLSIGQLLKDKFDIEILESKPVCGGIARTTDVNGIAYHTIGGHCFNSKYEDVLSFVFGQILPLDQWNKIERKSKIKFHDYEVDYPIEFSIKQIYEHDKELAKRLTIDFLNSEDDGKYANLEEWFEKKFGKSFATEYFIPYNSKIWKNDPKKMSYLWVEDKLPIPDKDSFFEGLISNTKDKMSHARFYYPKSNNQNTFLDALAKNLNIKYNYTVSSIEHNKDSNKWVINKKDEFDLIINTTPLDKLIDCFSDAPADVQASAKSLRKNGVSNVLWKTQSTDKTWTYIPNKDYLFHRYIHIGSYFSPKENYSVSEVIGNHSFEEMAKAGQSDNFLIEPLAHSISEYAYVVFDENYDKSTKSVKDYLQNIGIYTLGRFGEWQYYNMDVCIKKAIDLSKTITDKYLKV